MTLDRKLELLVRKSGKIVPCVLNGWNEVQNKPNTLFAEAGKNGLYAKIDRMIAQASVQECLTSNWTYVRKAKFYMEQHK